MNSIVSKALNGSINDQIKLIQLIEKHVPEKLEELGDLPRTINVNLVRSDGNGRPADRSQWTDWQREAHAAEIARRNNDPAVKAAWAASGLDDAEDETPGA